MRSQSNGADVHLHVVDVARPADIRSFAEKWNTAGGLKVLSLVRAVGSLARPASAA